MQLASLIIFLKPLRMVIFESYDFSTMCYGKYFLHVVTLHNVTCISVLLLH